MKSLSLFNRFGNKLRTFAAALSFAVLSSLVAVQSASAQTTVTFDPADTLAMVADAKAFIIAVGLAVLALIMLAKGIKWVRKAG